MIRLEIPNRAGRVVNTWIRDEFKSDLASVVNWINLRLTWDTLMQFLAHVSITFVEYEYRWICCGGKNGRTRRSRTWCVDTLIPQMIRFHASMNECVTSLIFRWFHTRSSQSLIEKLAANSRSRCVLSIQRSVHDSIEDGNRSTFATDRRVLAKTTSSIGSH